VIIAVKFGVSFILLVSLSLIIGKNCFVVVVCVCVCLCVCVSASVAKRKNNPLHLHSVGGKDQNKTKKELHETCKYN
jgi:hypothetical protein